MKISIIVGSHRPDSQSLKVGKYLQQRLNDLEVCSQTFLLDLSLKDIPFWDEGVRNKDADWVALWTPIENELESSDGFIIISPEYAGMVPAKLKNFFLLPGSMSMAHKPGLIVSVSAGLGGSYPVNELRTSSYKNSKICYIPEHIIVRKVLECLNAEPTATDFDKHIRPRIDYAIRLLGHYCVAHQSLLKSDFNFDEFKFGM